MPCAFWLMNGMIILSHKKNLQLTAIPLRLNGDPSRVGLFCGRNTGAYKSWQDFGTYRFPYHK